MQNNTMQYHAITCNTMQYHAIPCNTMQYHAIPCNTMQYYAIQCNAMQYHESLITADGAYHCPVGSIMAIFSSVRSSYSHPYLLLIHPTTHFFRSHRSSILDLHFLSHYSYIKAKLGKTLEYSGILWHTLAYSGILWHTLAYSGMLWHTIAYSGMILHTLTYSCILWHTLA